MSQKSLKPYREAQLTPLMKWTIIIGGVLFTIAMMLVMPVISFA